MKDTSPSESNTPLHLSEPSYDHRARHQDDSVSIISAMQESENGAYNPKRKFTYHINDIADTMQQETTPLVDEECRTRMLTWCSNVSTCVVQSTSSSQACILIYLFYVTFLYDT